MFFPVSIFVTLFFPVRACKGRWKHMRTVSVRQLHAKTPSGSSAIKRHPYYLHDAMRFMATHKRKSTLAKQPASAIWSLRRCMKTSLSTVQHQPGALSLGNKLVVGKATSVITSSVWLLNDISYTAWIQLARAS
jgi:hypothetical protein